MKSLPRLFFGDKPMRMWEKTVGTVLSALFMPTVSVLLWIAVVTLNVMVVPGVVISIFGLMFSIYSTWYLWMKIPLK